MNDQNPEAITTVETTVARELAAGGEVTVEVRVTAPAGHLHPAYALNAAAVAADTGLRATDQTHPANRRSDQCGRTFVHLPHDTTMGWCAGLDGTEASTEQLLHWSDCAIHRAPADIPGPCNCGKDGPDTRQADATQPSLLDQPDTEETTEEDPTPTLPTIIRMSADEFQHFVSGLQVIRPDQAADERDGWPTVDPAALERVLADDATQTGVYGTAVRAALIDLGLVRPNAFHGRRAKR